jgi:hypothetical protein
VGQGKRSEEGVRKLEEAGGSWRKIARETSTSEFRRLLVEVVVRSGVGGDYYGVLKLEDLCNRLGIEENEKNE